MSLARLRRGLHGSAALAPAGGGGGGGNPSFTATASPAWFNSGYSDTNHTFTSVAIGTAAAGRYVIVGTALHSSANKNVTAITVGGVSLTKAVESAGTANQKSSIWYGNVPTGATADIVVSVTASFAIGELAIVVGEAALPTPTPTATAVRDDSYTGSAGSVNLTVPSNGIGIVVGFSSTTGDIGTWTNATQDYETVSGANAIGLAHTTSTGALTISMAGSGDNNINMAAAAWGP